MFQPASSSAPKRHQTQSGSSTRSSAGSDGVATRPAGGSGPTPIGVSAGTVATAPPSRVHGPVSRQLLRIQWDYASYEGGPSTSEAGADLARLLSREEALRVLARNDPRPLLVVRECGKCNRTDRALLTPGIDNEKTILLSRWFHCVKLAPDVARPDHPLHALFPRADAEHLFVSAADGSERIPLEAVTSRSILWDAMGSTLARAYGEEALAAFRRLSALIESLDLADQKLLELRQRRDRLVEGTRPDPTSLRQLQDEIGRVQGTLDENLKRADELTRTPLKSAAPPAARAAGG